MSNLNASHKVMQHYLSALLTEEMVTKEIIAKEIVSKKIVTKQTVIEELAKTEVLDKQQYQQLNALLSQVGQKKQLEQSAIIPSSQTTVLNDLLIDNKAIATELNQAELIKTIPATVTPEKDYRKGRFQALFFQLAGLKVAVPLKELGGIHKLGLVKSLIGKPQWFKGVMLYREQKINIVDTARWVMPEKYDQQMQQQLNYQYVIMLANSNWGICCESLVNTFAIEQDDVQWREVEGKRPWMAGVIKEHMCVLVDVDAMIDLLNRGLDITA